MGGSGISRGMTAQCWEIVERVQGRQWLEGAWRGFTGGRRLRPGVPLDEDRRSAVYKGKEKYW